MNENVRVNPNGSITAPTSYADAQRAVQSEMLRNNGGRRIPKISALQQRTAGENPVYIFNVGPFEIPRAMGSIGVFTVPACPQDREYSLPLVIPGLVFEPVIKNEHSMELQSDDGDYVADQILGIGIGMKPQDSLIHYGIFRSWVNPPSKNDIEAAKQALRLHLQRKVKEMNDAHAMGPQKRQEVQTPEHNMAARYLGYDEQQCPWLAGSAAPGNRAKCGGCGKPYEVGVLRCDCDYVLDMKGYEAAVLEGRYGEEEREKMEAKMAKREEPKKSK